MTQQIIDYLQALAATIGTIENSYCLAEKREIEQDKSEIPYIYVGDGNYKPVEVESGSFSYFRLVNKTSFDEVEGVRVEKDLKGTYPIRFVAMVRRDESNPLTYSQDVANVFEGRKRDLMSILKARNVNVTVNSIDTDTPKIWQEEFTMPISTPNYKRSMAMIDLTVEVIASRVCWQNCANYPDILQGFPWCNETKATLDRLTDEQVDCISDELCEVIPCDPVTQQVNGTTIGTTPSGGTNNQVIQNSDLTPVGTAAKPSNVGDSAIQSTGGNFTDSVAAEQPYTIADVDWTQSDGTQQSTEYGQGIVCTAGGGGEITFKVYSDAGHTTLITDGDIGTTAYPKVTSVTEITPVEYLFVFIDINDNVFFIYQGAIDNASWLIDGGNGVGSIYAFATEDIAEPKAWIGEEKAFEVTGVLLLDVYQNSVFAISTVKRRTLFTSPLLRLRESALNDEADFTPANPSFPPKIGLDSIASNASPASHNGETLTDFVGVNNGLITAMYGQKGGINVTETIMANQSRLVNTGVVDNTDGYPAMYFDGVNDRLIAWNNTLAPASMQGLSSAITIIGMVTPEGNIGGSGSFYRGETTILELRPNASNSKITFNLGFANNRLSIGVATSSVYVFDRFESTQTLFVGIRYVFAVTIDGNTVKIYINGVLDSTHTIVNATGDRSVGSVVPSTLSINVRSRDGGQADDGYSQNKTVEWFIWGDVKTPAEIADIYTTYQN